MGGMFVVLRAALQKFRTWKPDTAVNSFIPSYTFSSHFPWEKKQKNCRVPSSEHRWVQPHTASCGDQTLLKATLL